MLCVVCDSVVCDSVVCDSVLFSPLGVKFIMLQSYFLLLYFT